MVPQKNKWNDNVKLILTDVDQTIADDYTPVEPEMVKEISLLLEEGRSIFFITGASLTRIRNRIINQVPRHVRRRILLSHCSGAEVVGFDNEGEQNKEPFYSLYDKRLTDEQKKKWREIVRQLIREFQLKVHDPMKVNEFKELTKKDPLSIMFEDRGPQITFEVVNGYSLTSKQEKELEISVPETRGALDLRIPILERAEYLLQEANIPVTPRLAGVFALDFVLKSVSKTYSIKYILDSNKILASIGLSKMRLKNPQTLEIWGDRFDKYNGSDRYMCEAVNPKVRAIDFREEDPATFPPGYNIVLWKGQKHLHEGLLEYLQSRHEIK